MTSGLPVERWFAAIERRRSRRSYDGRPLDDGLVSALAAHCRGFTPYPDARVVLLEDVSDRLYASTRADRDVLGALAVLSAVLGSCGRVTGARAALAVVGEGESRYVQEHAGYTGEAAVLEACALGLDTCWVGGFFSPSAAASLVDLQPGERIVAVSPVGYGADRPTRRERLVYRMGERPRQRLQLHEIGVGLLLADWPRWALAGLTAAQRAPSAVNRQPWRFRLDDGGVIVSYEDRDRGRISKRLDCGIAMLHFELGARHAGDDGAWEPVEAGFGLADVARWRSRAG